MSGSSRKLMGTTAAGGAEFLAVEDVFQSWLYAGNGSTQTITNGIDLDGEGGLVWAKARSGASSHSLVDTERGVSSRLLTNSANAAITGDTTLSSFNSDGFTLGSANANASSTTYASWTFRKAPRFFDVVTWSGNSTSGRAIPHNLGTTPGMIIVKWYDGSQNWAVWHKDLTAGTFLLLNGTNSVVTNSNVFTTTSPTDSVFYVGADYATNGTSANYVAYLFAHDPLGPSGDGSDGLIACGSYTGNGTSQDINLGWEPQWILTRGTSVDNWPILDNMRGIVTGGADARLYANTSAAEEPTTDWISLNATGYTLPSGTLNASGEPYIYIAIRRGPMRAPTSGTEVFDSLRFYGDDSTSRLLNFGFPIDLFFGARLVGDPKAIVDRLRGADRQIYTDGTYVEGTSTDYCQFDSNVGPIIGYNASGGVNINSSAYEYFSFVLRRAPGFFDVVAYTGDGVAGRTVPHNLGVAPEMMIVKSRNAATNWFVYHADEGPTERGFLDADNAFSSFTGAWNNTAPTDSVFTVGTGAQVNAASNTYIAYLFATLAGISKVGSYTGNGTNQTIDCGFTSGARFILIKRTDSTGDWYVWDTELGIVAGNDPHLSLNSSAGEATDDTIDPNSSGFIVNQVSATNVNVSSASYIYLAIA
jgi:hypothetical protein